MVEYNYDDLMAKSPTVYKTITYQLDQEIVLVEHPEGGDFQPVIAICHAKKQAFDTDFFDTEDFYQGSEYNPIFQFDTMEHGYDE